MKKLFPVLVAAIMAFIGCKKEVQETSEPTDFSLEKGMTVMASSSDSIITNNLKSIAQQFLTDSKLSYEFKGIVYRECLKTTYGDLYVRVSDMIALNSSLGFWSFPTMKYIQRLVNNIKAIDSSEPIVLIPYLEEKTMNFVDNYEYPIGIPKAVIDQEYDSVSATCAGYTINSSNTLISNGMSINEDYGFANDVWVFGLEEKVSDLSPGLINQ
jgi:hypothetical protein